MPTNLTRMLSGHGRPILWSAYLLLAKVVLVSGLILAGCEGQEARLEVITVGTGSGRVSSEPAGIDCGTNCRATFAKEQLVNLLATPNTGSTFAGWSGDADCADGRVSMAMSRLCAATFLASETKLSSTSVRGIVATGDQVMIVGFSLVGAIPRRVLVQARGPTLEAQGISGVLADPMLQVVTGQSLIAGNNDWQTQDSACQLCGDTEAIIATKLSPCTAKQPGCEKEAALLLTLPPGTYTAIVRGVGNNTGIALVEVHDIF